MAAILDMFPDSTVRVSVKQEQVPLEAYADAVRGDEEDDGAGGTHGTVGELTRCA